MASSRLQVVLTVSMCTLGFFGCEQEEPAAAMHSGELAVTIAPVSSETEADVERVVSNAAASSRAILFVHVDWSVMEPQRARFADFVLAYRRAHPEHTVGFHYVDCTPVTDRYGPLRSLPGWQELQDAAGTSLVNGWGELIWMEGGRVLHVEQIFNFDSTTELVKKTEQLMPPDEQ